MGALAGGLALSACAAQLRSMSVTAPTSAAATAPGFGSTAAPSPGAGGAAAPNPATSTAAAAAPGVRSAAAPAVEAQRNLTANEKKLIVAAVAPNLKDTAAAKYYWTKVPIALDSSTNYCAIVNAKSPYPPYDGRQAYVVEIKARDNQIVGATMALIAGGKDAKLVANICAKSGLDPFNAM
jgi:hypothetical protein